MNFSAKAHSLCTPPSGCTVNGIDYTVDILTENIRDLPFEW